MFCWVMALVVPMGSRGLLRAMQGLGLPRSMVQMSTLSIRYLSLMQSELRQMKLAMASRGYRNRWSLETYHVWAMIMGMLFLRSLDRSENLRRSMAARNVGLFVPMPHPPLSLVDIGAALAGLVLVGVVLTLEFSSLYGGWG
jgi:cobalt/nickel transport system permease protein